MSESPLKANLRVLSEQAVERIGAAERPFEYFSGSLANLSTERDSVIAALPAFGDVLKAFGAIPMVSEWYGSETQWGWLALDFVYGFLGNLSEPIFDLPTFEMAWSAFWKELSEPEWTWMGLANLVNIRSESMMLDLGDGITIRGRSFEELAEMGWHESRLERLGREWDETNVNSSHVILTEHKLPKAPDNFSLTDTSGYEKVARALLALRLHKDGDIGIGMMWFHRRVSFNLGLPGNAGTGFPSSIVPGSNYSLEESDLSSVRDLYDRLLHYEGGREAAPVNLDFAIRSFSDIYDRRNPMRDDTRLVDAITALESLLGTRDEITFRLAFRVALILGRDDEERVNIFERMKGYYSTRSRVVHGGSELYNKSGLLKDAPRWHLLNQQDLRDYLRRLLIGFVNLSITADHPFDRKFFENNQLDSALLHSGRRSELRVAMCLEEGDSADDE